MAKQALNSMLAEANASIETLSAEAAVGLADDPDVTFVDVRETVEVQQSGMAKGAVHAPRGFLEFIADPAGPMHNPAFSPTRRYVLYCGSGGRSALAGKTLKDMGFTNISHIAGGFGAWSSAGGPLND